MFLFLVQVREMITWTLPTQVSLVKEKYENCVKPLVYKSYPEYKQSDHKPVSALLEVNNLLHRYYLYTFS